MTWTAWRLQRPTLALGAATAAVVFAVVLARRLLFGPEAALFRGDYFDDATVMLAALTCGFAVFATVSALAGPFERATRELDLTQSVSPARWLLTRAGVAVGLSLGFTTALLATRSLGNPHDYTPTWYDVFEFEAMPPVVFAATLLACAVGVVSALLLRRTLPALVVGVGAIGLLRIASTDLTPHLIPPKLVTHPVGSYLRQSVPSDVLVVDSGYLTRAGEYVARWGGGITGQCVGAADNVACLRAKGVVQEWTAYHPASSYWPLQLAETGLLTGGALLLTGLAWWLARRGR